MRLGTRYTINLHCFSSFANKCNNVLHYVHACKTSVRMLQFSTTFCPVILLGPITRKAGSTHNNKLYLPCLSEHSHYLQFTRIKNDNMQNPPKTLVSTMPSTRTDCCANVNNKVLLRSQVCDYEPWARSGISANGWASTGGSASARGSTSACASETHELQTWSHSWKVKINQLINDHLLTCRICHDFHSCSDLTSNPASPHLPYLSRLPLSQRPHG